jgi:hypothetical protein
MNEVNRHLYHQLCAFLPHFQRYLDNYNGTVLAFFGIQKCSAYDSGVRIYSNFPLLA